jgi:hypothetical protein
VVAPPSPPESEIPEPMTSGGETGEEGAGGESDAASEEAS